LLGRVYLAMTGGQASLLPTAAVASTVDAPVNQIAPQSPMPVVDLPVIYADSAELAAHQEKIAAIRRSAGKAVWPEAEEVSEVC
jgi:DNA polymerase-3 subunit epsilon